MRYTRYRQYPVEQRTVDEAGASLHGGTAGTGPILAEHLDTDVHDLTGRLDDHDSHLAGLQARVDAWADTGMVVIDSLSPGPDWTVTEQWARTWGPVAMIFVEVQRQNTDVEATSAGNIVGDPVLFTLPADLAPVMRTYGGYAASITSGAFYIQPNGACSLLDAHTNSTIRVTDYVRIGHTYFTGT